MLTRQEAALQQQREREAREWREQVARRRQEEEQARREPRRDGRYVVVHTPTMYDPVPPPEEDILWRERLQATYEFPDQDVAAIGDEWRGTIRRVQGLRHGSRTTRFRRENFDSLVPVVPAAAAAAAPRRRRYRSLNAIMGQAAHQDAQAPGSDDDSQGSEEQEEEDIAEGVAQAQGHGWQWQEEVVFKGAQDHGWGEVGWQEMQAAQDAVPHQEAEDDDQPLDNFDTNVFLNLSDDAGDE